MKIIEKLIKKGMNKKEAYSKRRHYFYIPEECYGNGN